MNNQLVEAYVALETARKRCEDGYQAGAIDAALGLIYQALGDADIAHLNARPPKS